MILGEWNGSCRFISIATAKIWSKNEGTICESPSQETFLHMLRDSSSSVPTSLTNGLFQRGLGFQHLQRSLNQGVLPLYSMTFNKRIPQITSQQVHHHKRRTGKTKTYSQKQKTTIKPKRRNKPKQMGYGLAGRKLTLGNKKVKQGRKSRQSSRQGKGKKPTSRSRQPKPKGRCSSTRERDIFD